LPPVNETVDVPQTDAGTMQFSGSFLSGASTGTRTLAARGYVRLQGTKGPAQLIRSNSVVNANSGTTNTGVAVNAAAANLKKGQPYGYRLMLRNSRGLIGASRMHWFVYGGASDLNVVGGTQGSDRLHGSAQADVIRAGAGGDVIASRDGRRDYVLCGAGLDHVAADLQDRTYDCETVRRG
jgi:hypothetical protein